MVIFVKIIKLGQLQIPVESREPIMHSVAIAEQKKLHIEGFLTKNSQSDNGDMVTNIAGTG